MPDMLHFSVWSKVFTMLLHVRVENLYSDAFLLICPPIVLHVLGDPFSTYLDIHSYAFRNSLYFIVIFTKICIHCYC